MNIERSRWYTWQMLPGYGGDVYFPYFSPIFIECVEPLKTGRGILKLAFFNAFYAAGVQGFEKDIKVIRKTPKYLVGIEIENDKPSDDRTVIISDMEFDWVRTFCPELWKNFPLDRIAPGGDVQCYLNTVFFDRQGGEQHPIAIPLQPRS